MPFHKNFHEDHVSDAESSAAKEMIVMTSTSGGLLHPWTQVARMKAGPNCKRKRLKKRNPARVIFWTRRSRPLESLAAGASGEVACL
jgi:hypothetical protein